ncbi:hypothetical protein V6N13_125987 [Hibiscus sabdariffa]
MKQGSRDDGIVNEAGDLNSPIWMKKKRITGHVEDEDLWNMRRCLIEEVVQIEVGDKIFEIVVVELGFSTALGKKVIVDKVNCDVIQESDSETDTTSLQDKKEVCFAFGSSRGDIQLNMLNFKVSKCFFLASWVGVKDLVLEANSGVVARPRLWCESSWSLIGNKFDWNVLLQPCQSIGYSDGGHARKGGDAPC